MIHIGFTGTRHGMSDAQLNRLDDLLIALDIDHVSRLTAHHGDCEGSDAEFHHLCRRMFVPIEVHPGPDDDPHRAHCGGAHRYHPPAPHMKRNAAIVAASQIMIAAPYEDSPQPRGGTWATIRMALRALRAGNLRELHVVGRDGKLLEHGGWR